MSASNNKSPIPKNKSRASNNKSLAPDNKSSASNNKSDNSQSRTFILEVEVLLL